MNTLTRNKILIGLFFVVSNLGRIVLGSESVSIKVDRERDYYPGDLIELEVSIRFVAYARYTLQEPRHRSVRYLETQLFPVRKSEDGPYEQRWIVLYQIIRSGSIGLDGGSLKNESNAENNLITLEAAVVIAKGFGVGNDSNAPELLVDHLAKKEASRWISSLVALAGIALAGIALGAFLWRRKNSRLNRNADEENSQLDEAVEGLLDQLEGGKMPMSEIELFLRDYSLVCSPSVIECFERILYSKNGNVSELADHLRKEFLR